MYLDLFLASLALIPVSVSAAGGLYEKGSSVLQIDGTNYDKLIAKSNYTSIVEFYAPWCGHCKNLKPAYEKAATSLAGFAKVAAVNCDEELNKPFCGSMGVQGFPTLKIVKPSKKKGKPIVEDYQGQRTAKAINDALIDKITNHVTKIKDDGLDAWLTTDSERPKALFFSDKGLISPLVKALAIDFLGAIDIAHVHSAQKNVASKYNVAKFPTVVLIPGGDKEPITYNDDMKKPALLTFLSQVASPNPDALPASNEPKAKNSTKKDKSKSAGKKSAAPAPSVADAGEKPAAASETLQEEGPPTTSPEPQISQEVPPPVRLPVEPAPKLMPLEDEAALQKTCLHHKATMCILAFTAPEAAEHITPPADAEAAPNAAEEASAAIPEISEHAGLLHLREIAHKHKQRGAKLFPFYSIPDTNAAGVTLLQGLSPSKVNTIDGFTLIAINAKKGWWTPYSGAAVGREAIEAWIDNIRFGEAVKETLPENVVSMIVEQVEESGQPFQFTEEKGPQLSDAEREQILKKLRVKEKKIKQRAGKGAGAASEDVGGDESPIKIEILEMDEHDEL